MVSGLYAWSVKRGNSFSEFIINCIYLNTSAESESDDTSKSVHATHTYGRSFRYTINYIENCPLDLLAQID